MIAAAFVLVLAAFLGAMWAYYDLHAKHATIQQLTADLAETERHLSISHTVCDTLAFDLAEAIRPVTDWEPPVAPVETPVHDAVVVDLFARQLEGPSERWPL